ncbi:MAG: hypothetical protein HRT82_10655 [Henriciella sp.]|nr:hypothetical protein [Henriciella sp.]
MARIGTGQSSGNMYAIAVAALAGVLFFGILMWPSGSDGPARSAELEATPLTTMLDDAATHRYLAALERVKPAVAKRLHRDAADAIASGANADAVAVMVLEAHSDDLEKDAKHLLRADVKYFDQMMRMTQTGFATLSSQAPKYCRPAHYQRFEHMDPTDIAEEMSEFFQYDTQAYQWIMRFNVIVLEAMEDGRKSPNKYDRLNANDQMALQATMMKLMKRPQVAQMMRLQSKSQSEQRRAVMNMNMCSLASDVLSVMNTLPTDTKSRLLGELQHQTRNGDFQRVLRTVQSGI